jgi:hypothetical protein
MLSGLGSRQDDRGRACVSRLHLTRCFSLVMVLFLRATRLEPVFRGRGKVPESRGGLYEFDPYLCLTQEAGPETHHTTL